jgi:hypothetical protein
LLVLIRNIFNRLLLTGRFVWALYSLLRERRALNRLVAHSKPSPATAAWIDAQRPMPLTAEQQALASSDAVAEMGFYGLRLARVDGEENVSSFDADRLTPPRRRARRWWLI